MEVLLNFIFRLFISGIQEYHFFLYIDVVSCNLVELIYSSSFLFDYMEFSKYKTRLQTDIVLLLPFQSMYFYFFSYLVYLDRTSRTMLNGSGKSRHPCLNLNIRRKINSFSPLSIILGDYALMTAYNNWIFKKFQYDNNSCYQIRLFNPFILSIIIESLDVCLYFAFLFSVSCFFAPLLILYCFLFHSVNIF